MLTSPAAGLGDGVDPAATSPASRPPPVTLVISSLGSGGAERVMSLMANHWAGSGRAVTLITLSGTTDDHFTLDPRVRRVGLGVLRPSRNKWTAIVANVRRMVALRRAITRAGAGVAISFGESTNVLTVLAGTATGVRVVVSERIDPRYHPVGRPWEVLRGLAYRRAARLVVQTEATRDWASRLVGPRRSRVIANPVGMPHVVARPVAGAAPTVLGVGRLVPQKGFDDLVRAFGTVAERFPAWRLVILGDGTERGPLTELARSLGIAHRVELPGIVDDPARMMAESELFVLSSRYEGFPNVLLEAMSVGMAVISTDCPSGPRDIVESGVNGILVPVGDPETLAVAMAGLMSDPTARRTLGDQATLVRERFRLPTIMAKWDALLAELSAPRSA